MSNKRADSSGKYSLRQRAEERFKKNIAATGLSDFGADTQRHLQELQIHQIELEMQNEELLQTRATVETLLEQYTDLYDFAPVGYFTLDRDGTITRVNLTGANLLGQERARLVNSSFGLFVSATDLHTFNEFLQTAFTKREAVSGKASCEVALGEQQNRPHSIESSGGRHAAEANRCHVRIEGMVTGQGQECRTVVIDISERKRAEAENLALTERLRHADKMEAIGTLAGGIAHDFNNLLTGIQGDTSLTLLDLEPSHPHYVRLKRIEEQVQSGADLTRQLLGFARGGRYDIKPADMNDILEKSSLMFGRTKREISIHRKYGKNLRSVEVDRGQIEQLFMNLYVNAWQAMPGGGKVYLETEDVLLDDKQVIPYAIAPGNYVKISVTDTGTGMDQKTSERIFDPFFTTKEMGRGTGLGLAMVYGIIKGHKGMINVYSKPGQGTTFCIYLPASEKVVVKEPIPTDTIDRGTETILLVDDEKLVLEVNKELLESMGYRVYAFGNGQDAISVCMEKRTEIDLVILDMIMPGISGGEIFDRLREINPGIKVLLSSGYSIEGQAREILNRGCNGFLQKPFRLTDLSRKVREMLK